MSLAAAQVEAAALQALQLGTVVLSLVEKVEVLELQRQHCADSWQYVPPPQGRPPRLCYALWRVFCFIAVTSLIDVSSMLGFPVYLGWGRMLLAGCHIFLAAGIVSRLFGVVGTEALSAPLTATARALPVTVSGWLALAIISIFAVVVFHCNKDFPARASAVEELRGVTEKAALQDRLQQVATLASLCQELKAWADLCTATHKRDSERLYAIKLNRREWQEHPIRTMQRSARGAVSSLKAILFD